MMKRNLLSHMALNGRKLEGFVLYPDAWTNAAVHSEVWTSGMNVPFAVNIGHRMNVAVGISEPPPVRNLVSTVFEKLICFIDT